MWKRDVHTHWTNNPAIQLVRNSGGAPQPGSTIAAIYAIGGTSACQRVHVLTMGTFLTGSVIPRQVQFNRPGCCKLLTHLGL